MSSFSIKPIGIIHSPFKEKFGIPRQSGLIKSASANIEFFSPYNDPDAFKGLEHFSHIWLTFCFHQNDFEKWRPLIRPPRLGGNEKVGVFASRSSFRPNGLGMSVVKLISIEKIQGSISLKIACPDLLDGTPIFDIKPYIAYSDAIHDSQCSFAQNTPSTNLKVEFTPDCKTTLNNLSAKYGNELEDFIIETLSLDPRPAYHQTSIQANNKTYGMRLYDLNICWSVLDNTVSVFSIDRQ